MERLQRWITRVGTISSEGRTPGAQRPQSRRRRHDDVSSGFRQKKTPGFWPGVYSPNGGSGGKGGCRPAITQSRRAQRGRTPDGSCLFERKSKIVIHSVHRSGGLPFSGLSCVTRRPIAKIWLGGSGEVAYGGGDDPLPAHRVARFRRKSRPSHRCSAGCPRSQGGCDARTAAQEHTWRASEAWLEDATLVPKGPGGA